jgi:hypothetical protein
MPELEITDEQASYLDDLRDAIESDIVGPYGTVHRKDALQYLIDNFGAPDELSDGVGPGESVDDETEPADDAEPADGDASEDEEVDDEDENDGGKETEDEQGEDDDDDDEADADGADDDSEADAEEEDNGDDDMLNEMMSLLDTHDDKWTEADTEETKYEVELPDGESETVQTKDDVRALLFKNYR